jgi:hypothetical protein
MIIRLVVDIVIAYTEEDNTLIQLIHYQMILVSSSKILDQIIQEIYQF